MKKAILAIMVLGLCFGLANAAMADETDNTHVTVKVNSVEALEAPADVTITMDYTAGQSDYTVKISPETGNITYVNNNGESQTKKLTATAEADGANADNDIGITVTIDGQERALVEAGVAQTDVVLIDSWDINIGQHINTRSGVWDASATVNGTPAGDYGFTIEFTVTDAGQ